MVVYHISLIIIIIIINIIVRIESPLPTQKDPYVLCVIETERTREPDTANK